jgi:NADPH:quinone reductase-like Zn-dependent oxidoreductase
MDSFRTVAWPTRACWRIGTWYQLFVASWPGARGETREGEWAMLVDGANSVGFGLVQVLKNKYKAKLIALARSQASEPSEPSLWVPLL